MPSSVTPALTQLLVVVLTVVASSVLAYTGKIDGTTAQTIYLTVVAYTFGHLAGSAVNNKPPNGA